MINEANYEIQEGREITHVTDDLSSLRSHDEIKIDSGRLKYLLNEVKNEVDALPAMDEEDYKELLEIQDEDEKIS